MKNHDRITMLAMAGLLSLAPAFAQNQGATAGAQTSGAPLNEDAAGQHDHGATREMGQTGDQNSGSLSNQDRKFLLDAASAGMMEVELGRLAAERAASAEVKTFAQKMVQDHSQANQRLMSVASQIGISVPKDMKAEHKKHRDQLSGLSGADFDRMYMSHMVKDHEKNVKEFEKQTRQSDSPAVRSFAQQTLPALRQHLELAHDLAAAVGAPGHHGSHGNHGNHDDGR